MSSFWNWCKAAAAVLGPIGTILLGWAGEVATMVAAALLGLASAVAIAVAGVHTRRRRHEHKQQTTPLRWLFALGVVEAVLALVVAAEGIPLLVGVVVTLASALALILALAANQMSAQKDLGEWRGTAEVKNTKRWRWLLSLAETLLEVPGMRHVRRALDATPPAGRVSWHAMLAPVAASAASVLLLFAAAEAAVQERSKGPQEKNSPEAGERTRATTTAPTESAASPKRGAHRPTPTAPANNVRGNDGCGPITRIGKDAPTALATQLRALVTGSRTLRWDGAGTDVTGCMGEAFTQPAQPGVYLTVGYCGGDLRSLGVVSGTRRAHLLLQQRARVAAELAGRSMLLGASAYIPVGSGDLQTIDTPSGTHLLIRARSSAGGATAPPTAPTPCSSGIDENVTYVHLEPVPAAAYRTAIAVLGEFLWPQELNPLDGQKQRFMLYRATPSDSIGEIICGRKAKCTLTVHDDPVDIIAERSFDACVVAAVAPEPVPGQQPDPTDPQPCG